MRGIAIAILVLITAPLQSFAASPERPCTGDNFTINVTFDGKPVKFASIGGSFADDRRGQSIGNYCEPTDARGIAKIGLLDGENSIWIWPTSDIAQFAAPSEFNVKVANTKVVSVTDSDGKKITQTNSEWILELSRANFFGRVVFDSAQNVDKSGVNLACNQPLLESQFQTYSTDKFWGYNLKSKRDCIVGIDISGRSIFRAYMPVCSLADLEQDCGELIIPNPNVKIKIIQSDGLVSRAQFYVSRIYGKSIFFIDHTIPQNSSTISELYLSDGSYFLSIPNNINVGSPTYETAARSLEIRVSGGKVSEVLDFSTGGKIAPVGELITIDYRAPTVQNVKFELVETLPGQFIFRLANFGGSSFEVAEIEGSNAKIEIRSDKTIRVSNLEEGSRVRLTAYIGGPGSNSIAISDLFISDSQDPNYENARVAANKAAVANKAVANKAAADKVIADRAAANKAAADKAAAEFKAKQEAEAKVAAELKAKQEAEAKTAALKKVTITCIKGKLTKKVTGTNPKCPTGYKKK